MPSPSTDRWSGPLCRRGIDDVHEDDFRRLAVFGMRKTMALPSTLLTLLIDDDHGYPAPVPRSCCECLNALREFVELGSGSHGLCLRLMGLVPPSAVPSAQGLAFRVL